MPRPNVAQLAPDERLTAAIEEWIRGHGGAYRRLASDELGRYPRRRLTAGWRLDIEFGDRVRQLDVCLDEFFPHSAAHAFLVNPPKLLTWPHVQRDGLLCLLPGTAQVDLAQPVRNVAEVIGMAVSLIEELVVGGRQEDFRDEFDSYWTQSLNEQSRTFLSLIMPKPPSRRIVLFPSKHYDLVGESEEDLNQWVRHRAGKPVKLECISATFVWLDKPWLPAEYPKSAKEILSLVKTVAPDSHELIQQLLFEDYRRTSVVVGAPTASGPCLAAVTLFPPEHKYQSKSLEKGFRRGKAPASILRARASTSCTIRRSQVYRVDADWIHGRGMDPYAQKLRSAKVAILGCGSIGAVVAITLAQAGIGTLVLVDSDHMSAANMGRHPLGAEHLLEFKTKALAHHITQRFPHAQRLQTYESRCEDVLQLPNRPLNDCSAIVSVMGNWGSESALNDWHRSSGRPFPIIYGWAEPFACAGHAVVVAQNGGCLQCGMSTRGTPKLQVTEWPGETIRQEPGCGTFYQPYGPIELSHVNSMIAEMVIGSVLGNFDNSAHRVWVGRKSLVDASGGAWTKDWLPIAGSRVAGSFVEDLDWPVDATCRCGEAGVA